MKGGAGKGERDATSALGMDAVTLPISPNLQTLRRSIISTFSPRTNGVLNHKQTNKQKIGVANISIDKRIKK